MCLCNCGVVSSFFPFVSLRDTKVLDSDDVKGPQQITDSKHAMPHIGTIRPDEDFTSLLKDGVSLNKGVYLVELKFPYAIADCCI